MQETIDEREIARRVGARIEEARRRSKYPTQEKLAEALGVTQGTVSAYENGLKMPPLDRLVSLATVLGVALVWLLVTIDPKGRGGMK